MPFLKKSGASRHRSSPRPRGHSRRDEDSFVHRGAEILRQQMKRQDDLDVAYYSKLDPDLEQAHTPLNKTSSFSSDEFMNYAETPNRMRYPEMTKNVYHQAGSRKTKPDPPTQRLVRPPSMVYQSQSSDISFPASTDDDGSLFTDSGRPPPPPLSELDSSFSFLDDNEWADMQRTSADDLGVCSPAWSMPAKQVSDGEDEDGDEEKKEDADDYDYDNNEDGMTTDLQEMEYSDGVLDDDEEENGLLQTEEETLTLNYTSSGCQICPTAARPATPQQARSAAVVKKTPARECFRIPSPLSFDYEKLDRDPAFRHAVNAGHCWQSLVGQLVRFPSTWWNGARGPPLGVPSLEPKQPAWQFYGRCRVYHNKNLKKMVPNRASPGVLLLHLIVQDLMTLRPMQDVVVGVFHPNARGVRRSLEPEPDDEYARDLWMAVRKREESVSVVDHVLSFGKLDGARTPLGSHHVTNHNMRAVFGDHPPMDTMFLAEDILYDRLARSLESSPEFSPAEALLDLFCFEDW